MLRNLLRVTDDEFAVGMSTQEDKVVKPSWMETLKETTKKWLDNLPKVSDIGGDVSTKLLNFRRSFA